jgi:hypothetical protein
MTEDKITTIKEILVLVNIQIEEQTSESFLNVLKAFLQLPISYFAMYSNFRHSVIQKLKEYQFYEDDSIQLCIKNLKEFLYEAFMEEEFEEFENSQLDDEDYDWLVS